MTGWDDGMLCGPLGEAPPIGQFLKPEVVVAVLTHALGELCRYIGVEAPSAADVAAMFEQDIQ